MPHSSSLFLVIALTSISTAWAEKNANLAPKIASQGLPVVVHPFDSPLAAPLAAVKGAWKVEDGSLIGTELPADKHAAVLNYQQQNRNSVVRFSFKLDGSTKGFNFSLNHAKGHLFRIVVAPQSMSIQLDKDKKDAASKALVLATASGKFQAGQWYTMQLEMIADRVVAQTDNGILLEASHPKLDVDKPGYRFVVKGDSLTIDDLHISEVK